jgi:hypothetical protein
MLPIKRSWKLLLKFPGPGLGQLLLSPAWNKRIETSIRRKRSLRATYHTMRSLALINAQSNSQSVPDIPYHADRTHDSLKKDTPSMRPVSPKLDRCARLVSLKRMGGLHHRYDWEQACS